MSPNLTLATQIHYSSLVRGILAALFLILAAAVGRAEVFYLRDYGLLEIFPVGQWIIRGEDVGEYKIVMVPKQAGINAVATLTVVAGGRDEFPTVAKIERQLQSTAQRLQASGEFSDRKATLKPIYHQQGFGSYFVLTDAKLVGRPAVSGDFKKVCLGLIRLGPTVMVRMQILSDGEETEAFQQLLGLIEGMELRPK